MAKIVLITGVAGMIGSHLADKLLERRYRVIGVDNLKVGTIKNIEHNLKNKNFKFKKCDILDAGTLRQAAKGVNTIIHLAASKKIGQSGDAFKTLTVNADGTRNILEIAKKERVKTVLASTSDVYGMSKDLPFKEPGALVIGPATAKRWAYAASKIYAEQLAFAYHKEFGVPIVVLRYFGGFSHRASVSWSGGHIPLFINAVLNDKEIIIHGDGSQTRSMAYVDDLVNGTILAMENTKAIGEIFNIGNDEEMSVIDSARLIYRIAGTGKKLRLRFIPFQKIFGSYEEIERRVPDLTKARRVLGYRPAVSLREGIEMTVERYRG